MNLSQEDVAEKINKARQTYNRYEAGTLSPDIETLILLADLYQTSTDLLLGRASTADELLKLIPGYAAGQLVGNTINRKRASKKRKKKEDQ